MGQRGFLALYTWRVLFLNSCVVCHVQSQRISDQIVWSYGDIVCSLSLNRSERDSSKLFDKGQRCQLISRVVDDCKSLGRRYTFLIAKNDGCSPVNKVRTLSCCRMTNKFSANTDFADSQLVSGSDASGCKVLRTSL